MPKRNGDAGQTLVIMALGMVVLLGFLGLGIDLGYLRSTKRRLQMLADASALAGAMEARYCGGTSGCSALTTAAQDALTENGFAASTLVTNCGTSSDHLTITVNNPPCSLGTGDPHNGDAKYVETVVAQDTPIFFAKILGFSSVRVTARGEATFGSSSNCIHALDSTQPSALNVSGSSSLTLPSCSLFINSSSSTAVEVSGSSHISALSIDIVGHASTGGSSSITPAPHTGVAPEPDPLAYIPEPTYTPCASATSALAIGGSTHQTITPGTYCGGITIGNSAVVTFSPGDYVVARGIQIGGAATVTLGAGTYVMQGGGFSVGNSAQITGSGITFLLTGDTTFPYGPAIFTGASVSQLTAPTSGTYTGILFYQDSTANGATSATSGNTSTFGGSSDTYFQGSLYFPTTGIKYSGGSSAQYTIIVSDSITLTGSATINSDYSSLVGGSPIKGKGGVLVQ